MRVRLEVSTLLLVVVVSKNHLSLVSGQPSASPSTDLDSTAEPTITDVEVSFGLNASVTPTATGAPSSPPSTSTLTPTITATMPSSSGKPSLSLTPSTMTMTLPPTLSPTTSPSHTLTEAPETTIPTAAPIVRTGVPTPEPSKAPSNSPTARPFLVVQGRVDLTIGPVTSLLEGPTLISFLEATTAFLYQQLPSLQQDSLVLLLVGQSLAQRRLQLRPLKQPQQHHRHLQSETLVLDLSVSGLSDDPEASFNGIFAGKLQQVFRDNVQDFIDALQDTPDPYFDTINQLSIPSAAPVSPPPTLSPVTSNAQPASNDDDDDPLLSLPIIIGIAAGGGALILVAAIFLYRAITQEPKAKNKFSRDGSFTSDHAALDGSDGNGNRVSPKKSWIQKRAESQSKKEGQDYASDLLENQTLYSYQDNTSPKQFNDMDTLNGADTMSYAYSLDAGIEPSVMGEDLTIDMDAGGEESVYTAPTKSRVQIPSAIPSIMVPHEIGGGKSKNKNGPPNSYWSIHGSGAGDPFDSTVEDLNSPASNFSEELELTQSELNMLPSNLQLNATTSSEEYVTTRIVYAPPGKLGIVIDTTVEGPVVHKVNSASALAEQIWPGDVIVAIDDVDTRAMSASAITQLMVQTASQRRKLTVVSGEA